MPFDVDNDLSGVYLWFCYEYMSEVGLLCHLDSCATMNTGNLHMHYWLMTAQPHLVAEYIQYDDSNPFKPLQLACEIKDMESVESMHR